MIDWSPVNDTLTFSNWFLSYVMDHMIDFLDVGITIAVIFVVLVVFVGVQGILTRGLNR